MVLRRGSHLLQETGGASDAGGTVGLPTGTLLLTILTFGLFLLVVMLWLAASLVPGFAVAGFVPALLGRDPCWPPSRPLSATSCSAEGAGVAYRMRRWYLKARDRRGGFMSRGYRLPRLRCAPFDGHP
jgi:Mycobacterial 4 TMS phage holin, superfamily IV